MRTKTAAMAVGAIVWAVGALAPPVASAASCTNGWQPVSGPVAKNVNDMTFLSASNVWAVGAGFGQPETLFTEHWNGSQWTAANAPEVGSGDNVFNAVSAVSANDIWAVGYRAQQQVTENFGGWVTLAEHWDGSKWAAFSTPNVPGSQSDSLTDVTAISAKNVWAVGYSKTATSRQTLIEHWDGTAWTIVSSPNPTTVDGLLAVTAISARDIWAVGYKSNGIHYTNLFLHFDGTSWSSVGSSAPGVLTDVDALNSSNVWAVGFSGSSADLNGRIMHWDGSSWSSSPSPQSAAGADAFMGLASVSDSDIWAVGFSYSASLNATASFSQHWDGNNWSNIKTPNGAGEESELIGTTAAPDTGQVWAGGRSGQYGLMLTLCGSPSPLSVTMQAAPTFDNGAPHASTAPDLDTTATASTTVKATDQASNARIAENTKTRGAVIWDFNKDGWPDIFLGRHQNPARLYQNNGNGTFTEVDAGAFPHNDRHDCDSADVNQDGKPDLFCAVGANKGTQAKEDELWIQGVGHTFTDETGAYGVADVFGRGRDVHFIHANGDAYPDLFIGNMPDRPDGVPSPSRLYLNVNGTHFVDAPQYGFDREVGETGVEAYDYDGDGRQDLLLCTASGLRLYKNTGSTFNDVTSSIGLGSRNDTEAVLADVNNDGNLDSVEVGKKKLMVALQSSGKFSVAFSASLDSGLGVAVGDINGDNALDIYVLQRGSGTANLADLMYVNSGNGSSYRLFSGMPSATTGNAEDVETIDYNKDGYSDFLVLNGNAQAQGPINLIRFAP